VLATRLLVVALICVSAGCGGDASTKVPDVIGKRPDAAERSLAGAHLRWRRSEHAPVLSKAFPADIETFDDGTVVATRPAVGTSVRSGTVVTLKVRYPQAPKAVRDALARAKRALERCGSQSPRCLARARAALRGTAP
jgi:beta-lactam-binding protein with PASTA domain